MLGRGARSDRETGAPRKVGRTCWKPDVQAKVLEQVTAALPAQYALPLEPHEIKASIAELTQSYVARTIDIPRITVVATGEVTVGYSPSISIFRSCIQQPPR